MPDESREFAFTNVSGTWGPQAPTGAGVLRLATTGVEVVAGPTSLEVPYQALSGASWRTGRLTMHGAVGALVVEANRGLERAWTGLVARACPVPEFTRGLRVLGSPRSDEHERETRFFAPLLQARRRVEDESEPDRRVAAFAARILVERFQQLLAALAAEAYPESAPDRRAVEAELLEATDALFARLGEVHQAAERFRAATDETRFDEWRAWIAGVASVFAEADRSWVAVARVLPPPAPAVRRPWWRGTGAVIVAIASVAGRVWA